MSSFTSRRSKYFSRIGADGTVGAQGAGSLRVLGPEVEVARGDPGRSGDNPTLDERIVRCDLDRLAPPHVEQDEPRIAAAWEQAAPRGHSIDPELEGVRLEQRWIKTRVGLESDERHPPVDLADAVDQPPHAR